MPEYVDYAEYYDFDIDDPGDLPFYLEFAERCGSPILELACGTGRLLVPLAQAGYEMVGLDLSERMLAVCRRRINELELNNRAQIIQGNMAAFDMPRKDFGLIFIPVRSFMHLFRPADPRGCLNCARKHLRPGGIFIVDLYAPDYALLAQAPEGPFRERRRFTRPNGDQVIRSDRFVRNDPAAQIQYYELRFEQFSPTGDRVHQRIVPLATRYTFRYELELLLEQAGLKVLAVYRDYGKNPFDGSGEIIAVAQRPAA